MAVVTSFYMFSRAFDLGSWLPAGGPPSSEQPRKKFTLGAVAPPSAEPAGRRSHTQQASVWPRHGQLSRESEIFVIVRVYFFARRFYVANQASTTCRLCLESTVETSTPPFKESAKLACVRRGATCNSEWQTR